MAISQNPESQPHSPTTLAELNHLPVTRVGETIFIPLPTGLWRPCGSCGCGLCKADGSDGYWDTLAINKNAVAPLYKDTTWLVHHPELHRESDRKAMARKQESASAQPAAAAAEPGGGGGGGKRIMAVFVPQAWVNDYAIEVDGRVEFDVTEQILAMTEEQRRKLRDDQCDSDHLAPSHLVDAHGGPFRVEIEDAIEEYFAARDRTKEVA